MKVSLFIGYFNKTHIVKAKSILPIQLGKEQANFDLNMLTDNVGDNISSKNATFCELTAQYWCWKHSTDSDYIGLMHYRRFFDFSPRKKNAKTDQWITTIPSFSESFQQLYGLVDKSIESQTKNYDMTLPKPWDCGFKNLKLQYAKAPHHNIQDLELAGEIIKELTPDYHRAFTRALSRRKGYFCNMFIFKKELFCEYSSWLFKILFELEKRMDTSHYTLQEKRAIGYIAERLLGVFVEKKLTDNKTLRVNHLPAVYVENTTPLFVLPNAPNSPTTKLPIIPVVMSSDSNYAPHLSVVIQSVLSNANKECFIDLIILDGGINYDDKKYLGNLTLSHPHCRINFIDMSSAFLDTPTNTYFTRATFYRLVLPKLLKNYNKLVFLDSDLVFLGDVKKLYETELGNNLIAATEDLTMQTFIKLSVPSSQETGGQPSHLYLQKKLGFNLEEDVYFQAGVLVLNLKGLRQEKLPDIMINDLKNTHYWFLDQDILNKHLKGRVKFIDQNWNNVFIPEDHLPYLSEEKMKVYKKSIASARVYHYAGINKPWKKSKALGGKHYWHYLRNTPWYEETLLQASDGLSKNNSISEINISLWLLGKRVWLKIPRCLQPLLRPLVWPLVRVLKHFKGKRYCLTIY